MSRFLNCIFILSALLIKELHCIAQQESISQKKQPFADHIKILLNHKKNSALRHFLQNGQLFTANQGYEILKEGLRPQIFQILDSKIIRFTNPQEVIDSARALKSNDVNLEESSPYIKKLIKNEIDPLDAIKRAGYKNKYLQWAKTKIEITKKNDPENFVSTVQTFNIKDTYKERLVKVYSLCIDAYRDPQDRKWMRKIEINDKLKRYNRIPKDYDKKSTKGNSVNVEMSVENTKKDKEKAFRLLVNSAKKISREQKLDDWNKACLAKCIGDEMIEFRDIRNAPFTVAYDFISHFTRPGSVNLSHKTGVCVNYAGITRDIALELGFGDRVRIKSQLNHWFNQFEIDGHWYHFHPMRKFGKECTFIPY